VTDPSPSEPLIEETIARYIRKDPGSPRPGISFSDITPLIENGPASHTAVDEMARASQDAPIGCILSALSAKARGFVFGTALAYRARKDLILACKPNKLPRVAGVAFLLALQFLNGRERLAPYTVTSLISYKD
jgi:adenine/guanine phosphoribosyltransferase-like PRPP-binding protein